MAGSAATLEALDLSANELGDDAAAALGEAVTTGAPALVLLDVRLNQLSMRAKADLTDLVRKRNGVEFAQRRHAMGGYSSEEREEHAERMKPRNERQAMLNGLRCEV